MIKGGNGRTEHEILRRRSKTFKSKNRLWVKAACVLQKWTNVTYKLSGDLIKKISAEEWMSLYEKNLKRK